MKNKGDKVKLMKYFLPAALLLFLAGCTVGDNRGLLVISNLSDRKIEHLKLGDRTLTFSLKPGAKYDFWYFGDQGGRLSGDGIELVLAKYLVEDNVNGINYTILKDNPVCTFRAGMQYSLEVKRVDGNYRLYVGTGFGPSGGGPAELDYPAN